MTTVVIASADQPLVFQLRAALNEMDGAAAGNVVDTTDELVATVLRLDPDVVLVHDELGPDPVTQLVRDLALRRPTCACVIVSSTPSPDTFSSAMEAGARGVVISPFAFEDLRARVEAAAASSLNMRRLLASSSGSDGSGTGRARVVTFVGAKGGVGTTTIATHLALEAIRTVPGHRVCLVDLDLEKGDVGAILEVRYRASVADVAKVSDDLSSRAVGDAVVAHESGLHLLLSPNDIRDVEAVTPRALREIVAVLRQEYDLVVIDAGSHVTPAQATAVELADEVVAVTTPDVMALRGLRRSIAMWEGLAVRKESDVRVLINRASRQASVSAETVRQLTRAPVLRVVLPSMFRRLEPAMNARDPYAVREGLWWKSLQAIGNEIGLVPRARLAGQDRDGTDRRDAAHPDPDPSRGRSRARRSGRRPRDTGSVSVELVGILPIALLMLMVAWQLALYGMSAVWSGHAASVAAHAVSIGADPAAAVRNSLPAGVAGRVGVSSSGRTVTVSVRVPLVAPGIGSLPASVTTTRDVVAEPARGTP